MKPIAMKYISTFIMDDGDSPNFTIGDTYKVVDMWDSEGALSIETDKEGRVHMFPVPGDSSFNTEEYFEVIYCEGD